MNDHPWVLDLRDALDVALCGGKATKLAQLLGAGYRVPDGFCLTMEFYRVCLDGQSAQLEQVARRMVSEVEIGHRDGDGNGKSNLLSTTRREIEMVRVPTEMANSVRDALDRLRTVQSGEMPPLVVR